MRLKGTHEEEQMPTNYEVATNYSLWQEYQDPDSLVSETEFDDMPLSQRVKLVVDAFGPDGSEPVALDS